MWIIAILFVAGFWFWRSNIRRARRFVRSVHFLNKLDQGASINKANDQVARMFTKHSTSEADEQATFFAIDSAQRFTNGRQLPWIHEARENGFIVDSGRSQLDMANIAKGAELGKQVGLSVRNEITLPFTSAFEPVPERVFLDVYVAGFADCLVKSYGVSVGAVQLSPDQLGNFFQVATRTMVGPQHFQEYGSLRKDSESYAHGSRDAALYSIAMLNPSALDDSEAIVSEATNLAKTRSGLMSEVGALTGLGSGAKQDAEHVALIWAIKSLTLGKHFESSYGLEV